MSAKAKRAPDPRPPLLMCHGQFIAVTADAVSVHVLDETRLGAFYQGLGVCHRSRDPEAAALRVLASVFGKGTLLALPAFGAEGVAFLAEQYDGPQVEAVRGIAACILTGEPFGPRDDDESGGERAPLKPVSPAPAGPSGATFADLLGVA